MLPIITNGVTCERRRPCLFLSGLFGDYYTLYQIAKTFGFRKIKGILWIKMQQWTYQINSNVNGQDDLYRRPIWKISHMENVDEESKHS